MKFTKWNNPSRKRKARHNTYSEKFREEMQNELYEELAKCETEDQRSAVIKAYNVTMNPVRW